MRGFLSAPPAAAPAAGRRSIPAAVRRSVWERDGGRCTWRGPDGTLCGSRWRIEFDHVVPVADGGPTTPTNVRLLCRTHNGRHAEHRFGEEFMNRFRVAPLRLDEVVPARPGD